MPQMNLGPTTGHGEPKDLLEAGVSLFGYMTWPNDKQRRQQNLVTLAALLRQRIRKFKPSEPFSSLPQDMVKEMVSEAKKQMDIELGSPFFWRAGGWEMLAHAPGVDYLNQEIGENEKGWRAAGEILIVIARMGRSNIDPRGGASLEKAVRLIALDAHKKGLPRDRTGLIELWSKYKSVAHVGAAIVAQVHEGMQRQDRTPLMWTYFFQGLARTLAVGKVFQNFATKHKAFRSKYPLVDPHKIWMIPPRLYLPDIPVNIGPLSERDILRLQASRGGEDR